MPTNLCSVLFKKILYVFLLALLLSDFAVAQEVYNVKQLGVVADVKFDNTRRLQSIIDAAKVGSVIFFPEGIYTLSRKDDASPGCLYMRSGITLRGVKGKSVLRLADGQKNYTRILYVENCVDVRIEGILFDGNANAQIQNNKLNEHLHGIYINSSHQIIIENCVFQNTGGDGIGIRGIGSNPSSAIKIDSCQFHRTNRDAITLGSGFVDISISHCLFDSTVKSSIHAEPQNGRCSDVKIWNNYFQGAYNLSIAGSDTSHPIRNVRIEGNVFQNCFVWCCRAQNVFIGNNQFYATKKLNAETIIRLIQVNDSIRIVANNFKVVQNYILEALSTNSQVKNVFLEENQIKTNFTCIKDVGVQNLKIQHNTFSGASPFRFMELTLNFPIHSLVIANNVFPEQTIYCKKTLLGKHQIKDLIVANNTPAANFVWNR